MGGPTPVSLAFPFTISRGRKHLELTIHAAPAPMLAGRAFVDHRSCVMYAHLAKAPYVSHSRQDTATLLPGFMLSTTLALQQFSSLVRMKWLGNIDTYSIYKNYRGHNFKSRVAAESAEHAGRWKERHSPSRLLPPIASSTTSAS